MSLIVLAALFLTFLVKLLFENTVLDMAKDSYITRFESTSQNCMELFESTQQLSNIILTDENVQSFLSMNKNASFSEKLQSTLHAEKQLDYFDAIQGMLRFSSLSLYTLQGEAVGTNNIRSSLDTYRELYKQRFVDIKENTWMDLSTTGNINTPLEGIAYLHPYRNYASGKLLGHILIEYHGSILVDRFSQLADKSLGSYVVADHFGNVKMSSDPSLKSIADESYFANVSGDTAAGGIYRIGGQLYLVTSARIATLDWVMLGMIPISSLTSRSNALLGGIYLVAVIGLIFTLLVSQWIVRKVTQPLTNLAQTMQRFGDGQLTAVVTVQGNGEIAMLSRVFNDMTSHIAALVEQVRTEQRDKRRFEFSALQAQIHPHFLFNTLNSVCSLIKTNQPDAAYHMIHSIGMFYRTALSNGKVLISISEELMNVRSYIDIQSMRYDDQIRYEINVDDAILNRNIVKFTLQPLIENAIYHGVKPLDDTGVIIISGGAADGIVRLTVQDNGVGMDPQQAEALLSENAQIQKTSFGLTNIDRRLKLYFGAEYGLSIQSEIGKGTTVIISLPENEGFHT